MLDGAVLFHLLETRRQLTVHDGDTGAALNEPCDLSFRDLPAAHHDALFAPEVEAYRVIFHDGTSYHAKEKINRQAGYHVIFRNSSRLKYHEKEDIG
jgi:hypothetical protein